MRRVIKIRKYKKYPPLHIGDTVVCGDPGPYDLYQHSFVGHVIAVGRTLVMVKDQDGNCYDIERDRVRKL